MPTAARIGTDEVCFEEGTASASAARRFGISGPSERGSFGGVHVSLLCVSVWYLTRYVSEKSAWRLSTDGLTAKSHHVFLQYQSI